MATNCFENTPHESVDFCPNEEVAGGVATRVYYTPASFLQKFTMPTPGGDFDSQITIPVDGIEFKSEKGWKGIDLMADENELKSTLVGNKGNLKAKGEIEVFIPGFRPKVVGFVNTYKNVPMVWAIPDATGKFFIVGTKLNGAYMESADGTTGKKYEDNSGVAVKLSANAPTYYYAGEISESEATASFGG